MLVSLLPLEKILYQPNLFQPFILVTLGHTAPKFIPDNVSRDVHDDDHRSLRPPRVCLATMTITAAAAAAAAERIKVASAAFALKHHRDLLAAAESHLSREQASAVEMNEALLVGLRRHAEDAARTLRQRRWRKVVQLFVLLPVEPSMPPRRERPPRGKKSWGGGDHSAGTAPSTAEGEEGRGVTRLPPPGGGVAKARGGVGGEVVSGVSTLVDLPLPNNGDYSRECLGRMRVCLFRVSSLLASTPFACWPMKMHQSCVVRRGKLPAVCGVLLSTRVTLSARGLGCLGCRSPLTGARIFTQQQHLFIHWQWLHFVDRASSEKNTAQVGVAPLHEESKTKSPTTRIHAFSGTVVF